MTALPVVWLCGAPATGKSTVAWSLVHAIADQQICVGYVDIDQLGMVFPPPERGSRTSSACGTPSARSEPVR